MRGIAAVRPRGNVTAKTCRAPRTTVAARTSIGESGTKGCILLNVASSVGTDTWSLALGCGELTLKELTPAPNRSSRITLNEINRRTRNKRLALTSIDLLLQRFGDGAARDMRKGLSFVHELSVNKVCREEEYPAAQGKDSFLFANCKGIIFFFQIEDYFLFSNCKGLFSFFK